MNTNPNNNKTCFPTSVKSIVAGVVVAVSALCCVAGVDYGNHTYQGFTVAYRQIEVAVADSGRVGNVLVKRGSKVKKDQLLYELESRVLQASLKVANSRASAKARIDALKVEQEIKQRRYQSVLDLSSERAASPDELHRAEGELRVARLNVAAAIESKLEASLEVKEIEARIESRRSRSPVNGIVTDVRREVGEFVSINDPHVATVVDLSKLRITFYLPTDDAIQLRVKQKVQVTIARQKTPGSASVEYVGPVTEAESGRVRVDVLLDNARNQYRAGLLCTIQRSSFSSSIADQTTPATKSVLKKTTAKQAGRSSL